MKDIKSAVKGAVATGAIVASTVAAATSGLLQDPTGPGQQALTAPDWKTAAVAGGAAALSFGLGRHSATSDRQLGKYGKK